VGIRLSIVGFSLRVTFMLGLQLGIALGLQLGLGVGLGAGLIIKSIISLGPD